MVMGMSPFRNEAPSEVETHFQSLVEESATSLEEGGEVITGEEGEVILEGKLSLACSFVASTPVMTAHGKQPIGTLHAGEKVVAYNFKLHATELQPIIQVLIHPDDDLVNLTISTSSQISEVLHTNQKHPFLTVEKGFVPVSAIAPGMHVIGANGTTGLVTERKSISGTEMMYNLEIATDHTFTVGDGEWIVHNDCPTLRDGTAVKVTQDGLDHSFGRHAAEWFGRAVNDADKPAWNDLISQTMNSKQVFPWDLRGRPTIAVLARLKYANTEMRYFVVQFYRDNGELATAFRPNPGQLDAMFKLLNIAGR